jgi:hypothetical protein
MHGDTTVSNASRARTGPSCIDLPLTGRPDTLCAYAWALPDGVALCLDDAREGLPEQARGRGELWIHHETLLQLWYGVLDVRISEQARGQVRSQDRAVASAAATVVLGGRPSTLTGRTQPGTQGVAIGLADEGDPDFSAEMRIDVAALLQLVNVTLGQRTTIAAIRDLVAATRPVPLPGPDLALLERQVREEYDLLYPPRTPRRLTDARRDLAGDHVHIVARVMRWLRGLPVVDALPEHERASAGHLALCAAAQRHDPDGGSFAAYATACIRSAILWEASRWWKRRGVEFDCGLTRIRESRSESCRLEL